MAAAVVAAHNHVLRRWLRGESPDPLAEVDQALGQVIELFAGPDGSAVGGGVGANEVAAGEVAAGEVVTRASTGPPSSRSAPARTSTRCCPRCGD